MSVIAAIESAALGVEPGGSAEVKVRIRNQTERVDGFRIDVVGPMAPWVTVDPPTIQLFPKTEGEATVTFRPPRAPSPKAGPHPFGVRVQSVADPESSVVEEGDITIGRFIALSSTLEQRVARAWRTSGHVVTVHNLGNDVAHVTASVVDPEEELTPSIAPAIAEIEPNGKVVLRTVVVPRGLLWRGTPKRRPYSILVSEPSSATETLSVISEQRPIIPGWAGLAVSAAVLVAVAITIGPRIIDWLNGDAGATVSPSVPVETVAPTPTPTPVVTPTPEPSPSPTPTPTPEPTAPHVPAIVISGTGLADGSYLSNDQFGRIQSGSLIVQSTFDVFGNTCDLELRMPADVGFGEHPIGGDVQGTFNCSGYLRPMTATNGSVNVWKYDQLATVSFAFDTVDDLGSTAHLEGAVVGVFVVVLV